MKTEPIEQDHYFKLSKHTNNLVPIIPKDGDTLEKWIEAASRHNNDPTRENYRAMMKAWPDVRKEILTRLDGE